MEQHPVPQPITSYEFRLVGDMTLKQFGKLASGVILALIVYGINPPSFIKWFLIILFVAIGIGMAFFPFEGRPIDVWIIAFFKRIYSPTQYIWRQSGRLNTNPVEQNIPLVNTTNQTVPSVPITQTVAPLVQTPPVNILPPTPIPSFSPPENALKAQELFRVPTAPPKFTPQPIKKESNRVDATYTPNIAIPATPSLPNLVVGYIRTKEGKLVEGAILEIRDIEGNPARALKTNKLGQFLIATPLANGDYEIETEKEGFEFDIIKISLKGEIIPPIEIVSK